MKEVIIIGAGGNAIEVNEYIAFNNRDKETIKIIGIIDDNNEIYKKYKFTAPYLGDVNSHIVNKNIYYVIAIANPLYKRPIVERFLNEGAKFINIIHQTAYISPSAKIGQGVIIAPFSNLGANTVIGDYTLINSRASVGHDTILGNFNFIAPNVSFSGNTSIGDDNVFGVNSATIPGIQVGNRNKIAAGMILDKNIKDNGTVFHKFKEKIITISI
ncbi:acetyltransferase [Empedobacter falsenii]